MKDIKTFLIGFLTCVCMFLIMGQTKSNNQIGKYHPIGETRMIETDTGVVWRWGGTIKGKHLWHRVTKGNKIFK